MNWAVFSKHFTKFPVILDQNVVKSCKISKYELKITRNSRKKKNYKLSEKYSHIFDKNFAKFSVILVIFRCQIHEEPFFRFQVQIKAGALFSIFPPILNFQKWSKFMIFHQEKSEIQDFSYF